MKPPKSSGISFGSVVRALAGAMTMFLLAGATPALALAIIPNYESSWTSSAPSGATTAVNNVINELEKDFSNNITINLQFGWGDYANTNTLANNALGVAAVNFSPSYSLSQVENLITSAASANPTNAPLNTAAANLPSTSSSYSSQTFKIPDAEYKALTGVAQNSDSIDAYLGFGTLSGTGLSWDFTGKTPSSTAFDFTSTLEHEITHAMGRVDYAFASGVEGGPPPFLTPLNLYTYDCGTNTLDPNFNNTCLSIDGGTADLSLGTAGVFNNTSDSADWQNSADAANCGGSDSFDACLEPGVLATMSSVDLTEMCALGWSGTACGVQTVPIPSSLVFFAPGLLFLWLIYVRRRGRWPSHLRFGSILRVLSLLGWRRTRDKIVVMVPT